MEKGHVKIPIELYDKLKEIEKKQNLHEDELRAIKDSSAAEVKEAYSDICRFVLEIQKDISPTRIHEAADRIGFKLVVDINGQRSTIGDRGQREYKIKG